MGFGGFCRDVKGRGGVFGAVEGFGGDSADVDLISSVHSGSCLISCRLVL